MDVYNTPLPQITSPLKGLSERGDCSGTREPRSLLDSVCSSYKHTQLPVAPPARLTHEILIIASLGCCNHRLASTKALIVQQPSKHEHPTIHGSLFSTHTVMDEMPHHTRPQAKTAVPNAETEPHKSKARLQCGGGTFTPTGFRKCMVLQLYIISNICCWVPLSSMGTVKMAP